MKKNSVIWRIASIFVILSIGAWTFGSASGPKAETVTHERAMLSAVNAQSEISAGTPSGNSFVVEPVVMKLDDVVYKPIRSQYERWLAGEIDLDEMEQRVGPAERAELQQEALNMPAGNEAQLDGTVPSSNAPTLLTQFAALDASDCCGAGTSVPPDSDMAAGLNHLIAVENSSFEIYNKVGTSLAGPILFDNFLTSLGAAGTFDPTVLYDTEHDRFVMGVEDGANFFLMVTQTSDPTGAWNLYKFDARFYGDEFFDYPHIGIGDHAIFMGANMFGGSVPFGYEGRAYAMDKNAAYAGTSMTVVTASLGYDGGTPQPLNLTGFSQNAVPKPFNTHYFITDYYDGSTAWIWAWPNALSGGVPAISQTYTLAPVGGIPVNTPQLGGNFIQANDYRFRSFEYRNGYVWATESISYNPGSGTVNMFRWSKFNFNAVGFPRVDGGLFGNTASHYLFPDITANKCDDVAVGFLASDSTIYPGVRITGRLSTEPAGTLQSSSLVKAGEANYVAFDGSPYRWGDYSGMAIDPDGKTFWYMGEYAKTLVGPAANYGNYIASFQYPTCTLRSFVDVPTNAFAWSQIESIYAAGITGGCSATPLNYCPNNTVTRAQMAVFLLKGIHGAGYTPPAATGTVFGDVPASAFAAAWIEQLVAEGITSGCGSGNYCPNGTVTRAQMAVFLLRAKYGSAYTPPAATGTVFGDVSSSDFAAAFIEQLVSEGITSGCGGGNYCPFGAVTRAQMAVFLQRTFGLALP